MGLKLNQRQLDLLTEIYDREKVTKRLLGELLEDIKKNCKPVDYDTTNPYKPLPKTDLKATFTPFSSIEQEISKANKDYAKVWLKEKLNES